MSRKRAEAPAHAGVFATPVAPEAAQTGATIAAQRAAALDAANQVRIQRAVLRTRIKAGEIRASRVLHDWPRCIHGCGVYTFLTYMPSIGKHRRHVDYEGGAKAFQMLRKANAPGHKRLDQLTPAQMERLARVVRDHEDAKHPAERGIA